MPNAAAFHPLFEPLAANFEGSRPAAEPSVFARPTSAAVPSMTERVAEMRRAAESILNAPSISRAIEKHLTAAFLFRLLAVRCSENGRTGELLELAAPLFDGLALLPDHSVLAPVVEFADRSRRRIAEAMRSRRDQKAVTPTLPDLPFSEFEAVAMAAGAAPASLVLLRSSLAVELLLVAAARIDPPFGERADELADELTNQAHRFAGAARSLGITGKPAQIHRAETADAFDEIDENFRREMVELAELGLAEWAENLPPA